MKTEHQKSLEREHYGFVLYLSSFLIFIVYLLWAVIDDQVLRSLGIIYYPSRVWAILLPLWTTALIPLTILVFTSLNLINTPPLQSYDLLTDDYSVTFVGEDKGIIDKILDNEKIPDLQDVPLNIVNGCWKLQINSKDQFDIE